MIKVEIEGLAKVEKAMGEAAKQARYAAAVTLTKTAKGVEKQLQKDMQATFDNPTPWIGKGTFMERATKETLTATVGIKAKQAQYIKEHFFSGMRGQKPFERVLSGMGVLPGGYKAVPGAGLKLDSRGNPSRAQLKEIFGSLKSRVGVAKGRGKKMQVVGYFAVPVGSAARLHPGVWRRTGRQVVPVLIFVQAAGYKKLLDMQKIAEQVVAREFNSIFNAELQKALATAR
jgi:hypothetical protein